jgi:hypothetical protein
MGKMLSLFAAMGVLGAAAVALAGEPAGHPTYTTTGMIKSLDPMNHVIMLENGSTHKIARGVNIKSMKAGQKVTLTYSRFGGSIEVSAITLATD